MGVDRQSFFTAAHEQKGLQFLTTHTNILYLFTEIDGVFYIFDQFNFDKFNAKKT